MPVMNTKSIAVLLIFPILMSCSGNQTRTDTPVNPGGQYFKNPKGQTCYRYTQNVVVDAKTQAVESNVCRQADGTWRIWE